MIHIPTRSRFEGDDESFPAAASTWKVEWDDHDEDGRRLPPQELIAHFVTPYGTSSRRIRLRTVGDATGD